MEIKYREIKIDECSRIQEIDASQYIKRAWRTVDEVRQLVEIDYQDPTWPNGYEHHHDNLKRTIETGGSAIGAFDSEGRLIGFATVDREFFGDAYNYVLLDQLFITLELRGRGIGRKLFDHCIKAGRKWNADKIYICAGSAEETVAFYFAIGCKEATEINQKLYESDPRDFQLEFSL